MGSVKHWVLASRPKTLTGAMAPVLVGGALTWHDLHQLDWTAFVLCLLFAVVMQIDANLVNDYFDYRKGTDREDRLGPERACAQGWITPRAMMRGIIVVSILASLVGIPLILWGGWWMIGIGTLCLLFCFLYTTHLSYMGWGDVLVVLFFGIVPVGFTYYLQSGTWTWQLTLLALAQGLVTDNLLMVNNYRDYHQDAQSGKKTLVVRFGERFGRQAYAFMGFIGAILVVFAAKGDPYCSFILIYLYLHQGTYMKLRSLQGREQNKVLGQTARNILIFALITSWILIRT